MNRFLKIMPRGYWAASTVLVIIIGALMASTDTPSVGQAVTDLNESPAVARIGVVTDIIEADSITVRISGSPVLVPASYLFPQYLPVLGDRVYVVKQDAQWFVLGTMSGSINTVLANPSFESGSVGSTPTDWSITVIASAGGVPTFEKSSSSTRAISGLSVADFGVDSTVAGHSTADVYSRASSAAEGTVWTCAYWLAGAFIDNAVGTFTGGGGFAELEVFVQFLGGGALISEESMIYFAANYDVLPNMYLRPALDKLSVTAPAGTDSVRLRIRGEFQMHANSFTSFFLDYMVLRQVV